MFSMNRERKCAYCGQTSTETELLSCHSWIFAQIITLELGSTSARIVDMLQEKSPSPWMTWTIAGK